MIGLGTDSAAAATKVAQSLLPNKINAASAKAQANTTSTSATTASTGTAITSNDFSEPACY